MRRVILVGGFLALAVWFTGLADRLPIGQTRFDTVAAKARGETPTVSWHSTAILLAPERMRPTLRRWTGRGGRPVAGRLDIEPTEPMQKVFWIGYFMNGPAPSVYSMDIHVTKLLAGQVPHRPHVHEHEEIIIPLVGDVDFLLGEEGAVTEERAAPGTFRYHASNAPHTIRAVGPEPSRYLIFKWLGTHADRLGALEGRLFDYSAAFERLRAQNDRSSRELIFEAPTEQLEMLHVHASRLLPGGGYAPHGDPYDVGLVLLDGSFEIEGQRHDAPAVVFFPADIPHGMANPFDQPAEYLAIEFHGPGLKLGEHAH